MSGRWNGTTIYGGQSNNFHAWYIGVMLVSCIRNLLIMIHRWIVIIQPKPQTFLPNVTSATGILFGCMTVRMSCNFKFFHFDYVSFCPLSLIKDCLQESSSEGDTTSGNGDYYPDWETSDTCVNDGNEPAYMSANPEAWLHATLESCCRVNFLWDYNNCIMSGGGEMAARLLYNHYITQTGATF